MEELVRIKSAVCSPVVGADTAPRPFVSLEDIESDTGRLLSGQLLVRAGQGVFHEAGDVLFGKLRPYLAKSYLAEQAGVGTGEFLVLRPGPQVDSRFLFYLSRSRPWIEWAVATSYGTKMPRTSWEAMADLRVWLPPLEEQRRIADFLEHELDYAETLDRESRRQALVLSERKAAVFNDAVERSGGPNLDTLELPDSVRTGWLIARLSKTLVRLTNGYVGPTRDILVDEGVRYLQSLHIKNGSINFFRQPYYVTPSWIADRPRIRLREGDLLIVQTGAIGEVAIVDRENVGASCHALLIACPRPDLVRSRYLWLLFRSSWGVNALLREQTGALHPHLEAGKIRDIRIPIPAISIQDEIVSKCASVVVGLDEIERSLAAREVLKNERRRALITAAVTGQFDVATARGIEV